MTTLLDNPSTTPPTFTVRKSVAAGVSIPKFTIQVRKGHKIVWERETRNAHQVDTHKRDATNWAARKYRLHPTDITWK